MSWNSMLLTDILHTSPLCGLAEWLARIHFRESTSGALGRFLLHGEREGESVGSELAKALLSLSLSLSSLILSLPRQRSSL